MKTNLDANKNFNKMMQDASDIYVRKKYDDVVDEIFLKELTERKRGYKNNRKYKPILMVCKQKTY